MDGGKESVEQLQTGSSKQSLVCTATSTEGRKGWRKRGMNEEK